MFQGCPTKFSRISINCCPHFCIFKLAFLQIPFCKKIKGHVQRGYRRSMYKEDIEEACTEITGRGGGGMHREEGVVRGCLCNEKINEGSMYRDKQTCTDTFGEGHVHSTQYKEGQERYVQN